MASRFRSVARAVAIAAIAAACSAQPAQKTAPVASQRKALDPVPAEWKRVPILTNRSGHAMATLGDKIIVFGGRTVQGVSDETWEYDGTHWTLRNPAAKPTARAWAQCATVGNRVVLFGGTGGGTKWLNDTWDWDGDTWTERHPLNSPSGIIIDQPALAGFQSKAYLALDKLWVWDGNDWSTRTDLPTTEFTWGAGMTGGDDALFVVSPTAGTWAWDGLVWSRLTESSPNRRGYGLATLGSQVVMHGGCPEDEPGCTGPDEDTLVLSGNAWTAVSPATNPGEREFHKMSRVAGRLILFGGCQSLTCTDTWAWNGVDWSLASPPTSPGSRYGAASGVWNGTIVLFGGGVSSSSTGAITQLLGDTWTFDGATWANPQPSTSPPPRIYSAMAADSQGIILFGGEDLHGTASDDTWRWNGVDWARLSPASSPSPRSRHAMASLDSQVFLFDGGHNHSSPFGELWQWNGSNWSQLHPDSPAYEASQPSMVRVGHSLLLSTNAYTTKKFVFQWDGFNWAPQPTVAEFSKMYGMYLASRGAKAVLFGTVLGPTHAPTDWLGATYEWGGARWDLRETSSSPNVGPWNVSAWGDLKGQFLLFGSLPGGYEAMWTYSSGFALASPCTSHAECDSGYCVDGVCCDSLCDGQCEACRGDGLCAPILGTPRGSRQPCDGEGFCKAACDGTNRLACVFPGESTFCAPGSCAFGNEIPEAHCDGAGSCSSPAARPCTGFACDGTRCATSCTPMAGCASGYFCEGGACIRADAGTPPDSGTKADAGTATEPHGCGCSAPGDPSGALFLVLALGACFTGRRRPS